MFGRFGEAVRGALRDIYHAYPALCSRAVPSHRLRIDAPSRNTFFAISGCRTCHGGHGVCISGHAAVAAVAKESHHEVWSYRLPPLSGPRRPSPPPVEDVPHRRFG